MKADVHKNSHISLRLKNRSIPVLICVLLSVSPGAVWDSVAVKMVREGIRQFMAGEYAASSESFDAADAAQPDDARIAFDRACSLSAQGQTDQAKQLFRQAALARDAALSSDAHYNMGNLEAASAKETLGDDPVSLEPAHRPEVISGLMSAVGHYRDCLRMNPVHADARHNLELIRLFIKNIQAEWERRDREKAREESGLLEFLAMIETRQQELRSLAVQLADEEESPQQRQAVRECAEAQRTLQQEIEPLREKIVAEIQGAGGQQQPDDADQTERVVSLLHQLADTAGDTMLKAADDLQTAESDVAVQTQRDVLNQLNQIYMILAPFSQLLQRAIPVQQQLIIESQESPIVQADLEDASSGEPAGVLSAEDNSEQAWKQSRISDWSRLLTLKAEAELPQMESQLDALAAQSEQAPAPSEDDQPQTTAESNDPAEQLQALKESMQKAIELAPQVEEFSLSAENHLESADVDLAVPDQQEALRLLKEIAEPLESQQDQNDQQQDQNDQQQDQQNQNGQQDQQPDSQDQQGSEQDSKQDEPTDRRQQQDSARQRAEAVLRRAREREREHRDMEKEIRKILGGVIPVERDW